MSPYDRAKEYIAGKSRLWNAAGHLYSFCCPGKPNKLASSMFPENTSFTENPFLHALLQQITNSRNISASTKQPKETHCMDLPEVWTQTLLLENHHLVLNQPKLLRHILKLELVGWKHSDRIFKFVSDRLTSLIHSGELVNFHKININK